MRAQAQETSPDRSRRRFRSAVFYLGETQPDNTRGSVNERKSQNQSFAPACRGQRANPSTPPGSPVSGACVKIFQALSMRLQLAETGRWHLCWLSFTTALAATVVHLHIRGALDTYYSSSPAHQARSCALWRVDSLCSVQSLWGEPTFRKNARTARPQNHEKEPTTCGVLLFGPSLCVLDCLNK